MEYRDKASSSRPLRFIPAPPSLQQIVASLNQETTLQSGDFIQDTFRNVVISAPVSAAKNREPGSFSGTDWAICNMKTSACSLELIQGPIKVKDL